MKKGFLFALHIKTMFMEMRENQNSKYDDAT